MGGVLAELLRREDYRVTLVTPAALVSIHTKASLEQKVIQKRLLELDVTIEANTALGAIATDHVTLACVFTGRTRQLPSSSTLLVTARTPGDGLFHSLAAAGLPATRVGDCFAPATIAAAVHSGRKFAENFGDPPEDYLELPFRREVTALA
jgi:dimethylamine/trimethylamine dehydrogenase